MKILYRYLARSYLQNLVLCTVGLMMLVAVTILFGKIDNALAGWAALMALLTEIGKTLPSVVEIVMPLLVLLATVITITQISRHFELVSMKFAGMSRLQVMWPLLLCTVPVTFLAYANQNYFHRWLIDSPDYILAGQSDRYQWRVVGNSVYYLNQINPLKNEIAGVRIMRFSAAPFDMADIETAASARQTPAGWQLRNVVKRTVSNGIWGTSDAASVTLAPEAFPVVLQPLDADMHHLPVTEIVSRIRLLSTLGISGTIQLLELHQKIAAFLMPFLMIMLATPLSQIYSRNERVDMKYVIVVILGIIYMVGNETLYLLGKGAYLAPEVAVWSLQALYFAVALVLVLRSR